MKIKIPNGGNALIIDGIKESNNDINYLFYLEPTIVKFDAPPEMITAYRNKKQAEQQAKSTRSDDNKKVVDSVDNPFMAKKFVLPES